MSGAARGIDWDAPVPAGYRRDAKGNLIAEANISAVDRDADRVVARIHGYGQALSGTLARFRLHTLDDVYALAERIVERYGGKRRGGRKGNITLTTIDGRLKVVLAQAEFIDVGPEIVAAQELISECLDEWAVGARKNLRALVDQAFRARADGSLAASKLLALRRIRIDDPRWQRVRDAIGDALRPTGRAEYVRLYRRDTPDEAWQPIPLTIAAAVRPPEVLDARDGAEPDELFVARVKRAAHDAREAGMGQAQIREAVLKAVRVRTPKAREGGND